MCSAATCIDYVSQQLYEYARPTTESNRDFITADHRYSDIRYRMASVSMILRLLSVHQFIYNKFFVDLQGGSKK